MYMERLMKWGKRGLEGELGERETSKENSIEYMNILLIQSAGQHQEIMLCQDV